MCLAKACAAAFSLVTTMTLSAGSMTSKPAIIAAAALVLPAPKTPLMGQSVLPSQDGLYQCSEHRQEVTVRVGHQRSDGL